MATIVHTKTGTASGSEDLTVYYGTEKIEGFKCATVAKTAAYTATPSMMS